VLDVDLRRLLIAQVDGRDLAVRQIFSGREVARITREWTGGSLRDALTDIHFDPDGRLTFTWLKGRDRTPVTERVSVPSIPR
jgi:phosphoserine phosphatase